NDRARYILQNEKEAYDVNDLFFKYRDQFVYIRHLDPVKKEIEDLTLFKVNGYRVAYTIKAPFAKFDTSHWYAENAVVKTHLYEGDQLVRYKVEFKEQIKTLEAYEPQVIKSLYEGKSLTVIDSFRAWRLLTRQGVNSDKIRAVVYNKILLPLFAIGLVIILFFKLPMHGRLANMGRSIASSIAMTIVLWGVLYGFSRLGMSAAVKPEIAIILPISFFLFYALFLYKTDQHL
ncbi:MAG TPA: LptF/LptG family permease, partial [Epsilonproteobacteria bacterium]|nr:LptF/LptG family permease [Campylobacterota bacterium]